MATTKTITVDKARPVIFSVGADPQGIDFLSAIRKWAEAEEVSISECPAGSEEPPGTEYRNVLTLVQFDGRLPSQVTCHGRFGSITCRIEASSAELAQRRVQRWLEAVADFA